MSSPKATIFIKSEIGIIEDYQPNTKKQNDNTLPLDCIRIICDMAKGDWESRDSLMLVSKDIKEYLEVKCDREVKLKMKKLVQEKLKIKLDTTYEYEKLINIELPNMFNNPSEYGGVSHFDPFGDDYRNFQNAHNTSIFELKVLVGYRFKLEEDQKNSGKYEKVTDITEVLQGLISPFSDNKELEKDFNIELSTKKSDLGIWVKLNHRTFEHKKEGYFVKRFKETFCDAEEYLLSKADGVLKKHWQK